LVTERERGKGKKEKKKYGKERKQEGGDVK
jgi:hypothetical protein